MYPYACPPLDHTPPACAEHEQALCAAVPALSHVLGMPTIVANKMYLDQQQQQQQQQSSGTCPVPTPQAAPGAAAAPGSGGDGAMLQLECLHSLLLLLPPAPSLPQLRSLLSAVAFSSGTRQAAPASAGAALPAQGPVRDGAGMGSVQASTEGGGWALAARRGLGWLLRSRAGAEQGLRIQVLP